MDYYNEEFESICEQIEELAAIPFEEQTPETIKRRYELEEEAQEMKTPRNDSDSFENMINEWSEWGV